MSPTTQNANARKRSLSSRAIAFEQAPLITPELLKSDWREAFRLRPEWARSVVFVFDEEDPEAVPEYASVLIGKKHTKLIHLTLPELSILFMMTKLRGATVVTNSNFGKPVPQIYAKMRFDVAPRDLMSIRRILWNAKAGEQTKAIWRADDYSVENTQSEGHAHPDKDGRAVAMGHVRDHAERRAREGTFPAAFTLAEYLDNIAALFALVDQQKGA